MTAPPPPAAPAPRDAGVVVDAAPVAVADRLLSALNWALGCGDAFPDGTEGKGAFYWREELARRAGLRYDPEAGRYFPATPPPTDDGVAAMAEAVDAFERAVRHCHDLTEASDRTVAVAASNARIAARARVLSIHAAALARAEAAERALAAALDGAR